MVRVLGIGDNVCDIYRSSNRMYPGGQALNFAVYAKQLGADSSYVGVFGNDAFASHIIKTLKSLKVDHKFYQQHQGENGYAVVDIVNGDRIFIESNRGGIAKEKSIDLDLINPEYLQSFDLIHTSNNSYFNGKLNYINKLGIPISYDFSNKWLDWSVTEEICPYLDFGFLSCSSNSNEEIIEICKRIRHLGCSIVIATMGDRGALLFDGELILLQEAKIVEAIDTLGAGDSFIASFLTNYISSKKNKEVIIADKTEREFIYKDSLEKASLFAAKNCMVDGAFGYGIELPEQLKVKLGI